MRRGLVIVAVTLAAVLALSTPAAAHKAWYVEDDCSHGDNVNKPYFAAFGPEEYWGVHQGSGYVGKCHMYTSTVTTSTINWAEWYLPAQDGTCEGYVHDFSVDAWIDSDGHFEARQAHYHRWRYGHSTSGPTEHYRFNQGSVNDQFKRVTSDGDTYAWDHFDACKGGLMDVVDSTGYEGHWLGVDYLQFIPKSH